MLKLSRVEINGFKSFVDPVTLTIGGGITSIVGPNGCGKSNLSDAITWVLGEQSAKSLRGTRMEDVIFSGAAGRKPLGMAEVTLTLLTDPSFPSAVDGKVTIGRRVFRGGAGEYRLNGKVVRLKEIKDLLMDTGLGIRNYAVIEQGKIGMILSGKPQERRKLLEEAAGITRYKARKRIAELKLEEATANLIRLDDVISEVERALRSLKRQANAARRYKKREGEYKTLLDQVLRGRWFLLRQRLDAMAERLAERQDREAGLSAELHRDEAALAEGREQLDELARSLAARHEKQADLAGIIEGRQELIRGGRESLEDIAERLERGSSRALALKRQGVELEGAEGQLDGRTRELLVERDEAARRVAEDEAEIAAAQSAVEKAQTELEDLRQKLLGSLGRLDKLRGAERQEQSERERRTLRRRFLAEEGERLERQLAEAEAGQEAVATSLASAEQELERLLEKRRDLSQSLDNLLRVEAELSDERRRLESRRATLGERRKILLELSAEHADRRRALIERLAALGLESPRFLADQLRARAGWESSVDHYLGELADAVVLAPAVDVLALGQELTDSGISAAFLRPLAAEDAAAGAQAIEDPAIVGTLADALELPPPLARALPPAYLVDAAADALRLAASAPGVAFLSRGRLWAEGGVVHVQGEEAAPGVLAREHELATLEHDIPELEQRLKDAARRLGELVVERTEQAGEIQQLDERAAELRREIAVGHARRQDVAARLDKLRASHATVSGEQEEIAVELGALEERRERLVDELATAEEDHRQLGVAMEQAQAAVEAARERRASLREAGADRRGRLQLLEQQLEQHDQEASRLRRQRDEIGGERRAWEEERSRLEIRREELGATIASAEVELQDALERRARAQEDVLAEQERLDQARAAATALDARVAELRESRDQLRRELESLRVEQAGVRQDGEHLALAYRDQLGRILAGSGLPTTVTVADETGPDDEPADVDPESEAPDAVDAVDAPDAPDAVDLEAAGEDETSEDGGEDAVAPATIELEVVEAEPVEAAELVELETRLARAKAVIERLGPVNLLAAREFDEQQERHGFLTEQRADVADSVKRLRETIREINETSSARFRETFELVNRTFGETFVKLFRGGEAEMRLLDEDDLLDSGIEIVARPPGKRLQNIMLLSGGEKALTAVSLLFALFQTKPSPFCILDEVDAPLDDANVLRFLELLGEMARDIQFMIITHNKLTMERASTLYGVTMEEKGVSKLVSVELDEVQPEIRHARTA